MATDGTDPDRTALVMYGTETGTSQDLAEEAGRILDRLHFNTDVVGLDDVSTADLSSFTICLFVISTTGQGDFPSNARHFWTSLLKKKLRSDHLSGLHYALIGLGDSSYPKFNWAARKLDKRLKQLGAQEIVGACEADEQGDEGTDGSFLAWSQGFRSTVLTVYPLSKGRQPISDDVILPSLWRLQVLEDDKCTSTHLDEAPRYPYHLTGSSHHYLRSPASTFQVALQKNERMTPPSHWQDVRFLELKTEGKIYYQPGDALAIRPKNTDEDVNAMILQMEWSRYADWSITLTRTKSLKRISKEKSALAAWPSQCRHLTLYDLLKSYFDIMAIPRRSFFAKIARFTDDVSHKNRLLEFASAEYLDEYYDYATRPRRSILEVLQEFDTVRIPWEEAVNVFPALRPRQFSIASGGALRTGPNGSTTFELLIAVVRYRTVIKKVREGVCTRYLAALSVGTSLEVDLRTEGRFPLQKELQPRCHVLIGAGTGIAPLRSLIHEMQTLDSREQETILIFGARSIASDFFFQDEWSAMIASDIPNKILHVITAFSRDQKRKIYVQDRIREHGNVIFDALCKKSASVIVCGSSGQMPRAVREALVDVLALSGSEAKQTNLPATREEAEIYLSNMEKQRRYLQETW